MAYGREQLRKAGNFLGQVDDTVQGAARYVLGERDGKFQGKGHVATAAAGLGYGMHSSRQQVRAGGSPKWEQDAYLVGTRAMQAGGLTAAGYALAELATQFGGPADRPEPNQLSM